LVGIAWRVALGDIGRLGQACGYGRCRIFESMSRRRRPQREEERQTDKDVEQASHKRLRSSDANGELAIKMQSSQATIVRERYIVSCPNRKCRNRSFDQQIGARFPRSPMARLDETKVHCDADPSKSDVPLFLIQSE
jgi:hypothetical protein